MPPRRVRIDGSGSRFVAGSSDGRFKNGSSSSNFFSIVLRGCVTEYMPSTKMPVHSHIMPNFSPAWLFVKLSHNVGAPANSGAKTSLEPIAISIIPGSIPSAHMSWTGVIHGELWLPDGLKGHHRRVSLVGAVSDNPCPLYPTQQSAYSYSPHSVPYINLCRAKRGLWSRSDCNVPMSQFVNS